MLLDKYIQSEDIGILHKELAKIDISNDDEAQLFLQKVSPLYWESLYWEYKSWGRRYLPSVRDSERVGEHYPVTAFDILDGIVGEPDWPEYVVRDTTYALWGKCYVSPEFDDSCGE